MEAAATNLERWVEAAMEAFKIAERGMKEASEEAKDKASATKAFAKAANYVSSTRNFSDATDASTDVSMFATDTHCTSSVVVVARRIGYTSIITMLSLLIQ